MRPVPPAIAFVATALASFVPAGPVVASELVFVPIPPCRIIDTRCLPGSTCAAFRVTHGAPAVSFLVHGPTADYRAQGGTASGCGIPDAAAGQNVAQAIAVNLIAVGALGAGDFRAWPADQAKPASSVLNFSSSTATGGLNIANGVILPICRDLTNPGCVSGDLNVSADASDAFLVADVLGYFMPETSDITAVNPGTGLTGGGTSGAVTLGLQGAYQLPQGCASGQQPSWLEGAWICQSPAAGTITEVIAGTGLAGGGTSGPVTLSLAPSYVLPQSGCSSGQVVKWDATAAAWICADVTPAAPGFEISTVDASRDVDLVGTSITIGSDGLGLISYSAGGVVSVAHCADAACTSATIAQPGAFATERRWPTSIAIGTDGLGMISYGQGVIHCADVTCTSAIRTLNASLKYSSIAIGADGFPLISACPLDFSVAHCRNPLCTGAFDRYRIGAGCESSSIAIGADGLGLITFTTGVASPEIHAAHCDDVQCSTASIVDYGVGAYSSITIGSDGRGLISRQGPASAGGGKPWLGVLHCSGLDCSIFTGSRLDNPLIADVGQFNSITLGADGLGLISYYDATNRDLKVAHCFDVTCSSATVTTLDSAGDVGQYTSITTGRDGFGLIAYIDVTNGNLKVAHCPNALCVPYLWRR